MLIVAMAPSLNSNEVPPSITMQASQQRERTHTLQQQRHRDVQYFESVNLYYAFVGSIRIVDLLASEASLSTVGEYSVDNGLPYAVE